MEELAFVKVLRTSPFQVMAFMPTKSKTPSKLSSLPMGSCMTMGTAPSISSIMSRVRRKLAPIRSILFTKQMRGTLYL